jgi:DNA-binding CsgD family transcriptional regulator
MEIIPRVWTYPAIPAAHPMRPSAGGTFSFVIHSPMDEEFETCAAPRPMNDPLTAHIPDFLRIQDELAAAPSVESLLHHVRSLGRGIANADDIEITIMRIERPDLPGKLAFYVGNADYTPAQLEVVDRYSMTHPLFEIALRGDMESAMEPEDVAGALHWHDTPLYREVYQPNSVRRALFASLRIAPGFTLNLKAVRQLQRGFHEADRLRFYLLQRTARSLLRRAEHLYPLCRACMDFKDRNGGIALQRLGPSIFGLTPREVDVLRWVEAGKTDAEISILLDMGLRTVQSHVAHLLRKLHCENRLQVIATQYSRLVDLGAERPALKKPAAPGGKS